MEHYLRRYWHTVTLVVISVACTLLAACDSTVAPQLNASEKLLAASDWNGVWVRSATGFGQTDVPFTPLLRLQTDKNSRMMDPCTGTIANSGTWTFTAKTGTALYDQLSVNGITYFIRTLSADTLVVSDSSGATVSHFIHSNPGYNRLKINRTTDNGTVLGTFGYSCLPLDTAFIANRVYGASITPNPASGYSSVGFSFPQSGIVTVNIDDGRGYTKNVFGGAQGNALAAGHHVFSFPVDSIPIGVNKLTISVTPTNSTVPESTFTYFAVVR